MAPTVTGRSEQEIFDDLEELCASQGYLHVLALLSLRDNMVGFAGHLTSDDMAASYASGRTVRTEFSTLLGLMLKHPVDAMRPAPLGMQKLATRTRILLDELHECLGRPMLNAIAASYARQEGGLPFDEGDVFARGDVMREPIFYGGESAYSFQYRDFAIERYAADDAWLRANKGFGIGDAHAVTAALSKLATAKLTGLLRSAARSTASAPDVLPGFCFSLDEVVVETSVAPDVAHSVLVAFTASEPPTNAGFTSLGDFNVANATPILRLANATYASLQTYGVVEALYESPFYWMLEDKAYKNVASANRGTFTEELTARRLAAVFGEARVHRGVNVMRKGTHVTEVDVLILFAGRAIVVQCKSKKLTLTARKGNDHQLKNDFKKAVQDAYDQARLCAASLGNRELTFVRSDGRELTIPELRAIYPVCVVSDHYPALAPQARQFLAQDPSGPIQPAFVADVFLIDVMAEMLASPLHFLSYLDRRVNYRDRIFVTNEFSVLGHHLRRNLWIDDGFDMLAIGEDENLDLDTAMTVRREGWPGGRTPEGIHSRLDGTLVGKLIEHIEHADDVVLVGLGLMLLTLGGETLDDLGSGIATIARRTRQDGKRHDLTLAFESGGGLTVHCGPEFDAMAAETLARHCQVRKYSCRADTWYGLFVRPQDGLPLSAIGLVFQWEPDADLENAAAKMPSPSSSKRLAAALKAKKVGRNDPCPCGSGKKFKKCCGA
jgi:hypothetical protein